jgi:hypothetical protein
MTQAVLPEIGERRKPENGSTALMRTIDKAIFDPAFDAAKLAVLLEVKLKFEADEARKAYITAIQQFKANPPEINKTKHVEFPTTGGGRTSYDHAELPIITEAIAQGLRAVGITHAWRCSDANGRTTVTCVLTHGMGHSEDAATLSGPPDTSGGKNSIQAIGSTVTYLQRYTLLAATGLAATGMDNDGKTEGMPEDAIQDYCIQFQDASGMEELKRYFADGWEKAKKADDNSAKERLRKVYEQRKKELRSHAD